MRSALRPCEFYETVEAGSAPLLATLPRGEWAHQPLYRRTGARRPVTRFRRRRSFRTGRHEIHASWHRQAAGLRPEATGRPPDG